MKRGGARRGAGPRLEVRVERTDAGGACVGRVEGDPRPVVVAAGAVPGDRLLVGVERETRGARFGRVLEVLAPSPDRVAPFCPIVARCGGCPWQAMSYVSQLARKRAALEAALRAVPALRDVPVSPPVPALRDAPASPPLPAPRGASAAPPAPSGYRTKIQMPVGGRPGALTVGFYAPGSKEIIEAPSGGCPVQHPLGNRIVAEAAAILERARIAPYDERRHEGILRTLLVRVDGGGRRAALTLVVRDARFPGRDAVAGRLARIEGVSGVAMNVQPARGNVVLGRRTERLAGRERLLLEVAGRRFLLSPTAFFQTSAAGAAALVERARARLPGPYETLVDLYCGAGLFARTLADRASEVLGVEENPDAIEDALAGARLEGAANVSFLAAPAEAWAAAAPRPADAVVVDPPRRGLAPSLVDAIAARLRPRALLYVSCSPETLVRDLAALAARGYRTTALDPVDMFPHTPHLECVALLERAGRGERGM